MNKYICFNKNDDYAYEIEKILIDKKGEILDFFETRDNGTFNFDIYIYNTKEELHDALIKKNIITNKSSYQIGNKLYFYEAKTKEYKKNIFHEEIKTVEQLIYGKHPNWLSDGIATYIDNKLDIKTIITDNNIDEYSEPYFSYLTVSYLIEKNTKPLFIRLIFIQEYIDFIEDNNIIYEAITYYQNKYKSKIKEKKNLSCNN